MQWALAAPCGWRPTGGAATGSSSRPLGDPVGKVVEVFELGGRGEKLFVTVDLYQKGSSRRFSFQRLYNRIDATD